jgi:hypothetical protein
MKHLLALAQNLLTNATETQSDMQLLFLFEQNSYFICVHNIRCKVFTAVTMKNVVSWNGTLQ